MANLHTVYLALGSNLGNRAAHLHTTLKRLAAYAKVEETSFLYETKAQYVTDVPDYLNAVCRVTTTLSPHELLAANEQLMYELGRRRTAQYGTPRPIDIDILLYDDAQVESADLIIPHALMHERTFVLEPLCDMAPDVRHPRLGHTVRELLTALQAPPLDKVMPIGEQLWTWGQKTYIMGILNITPDSFAGDGLGRAGQDVVDQAVAQAQQFVAEGADCLDVGGISTRPGHALIPVAEELARVVPVIQALADAVQIPVSIDTFRAEVAQAALKAGARMINDIWGLRFDPQLAKLAADWSAPLVLMHNRTKLEDPTYRAQVAQHLPFGPAKQYDDLMQDIEKELKQSLALAQSVCVPRWLLITDPGMGFGKTFEQHLELIRRLSELKAMGYPLLFAASRKSFVGKALDDLPPEARVEGTLATGVLALERGADLLRVHDVQAMSRAARMADAVVRHK
ncbi:MAG: dihydropteroate synthase [Chloroflexi bacterium]|nr:dihydropteroate synthase [Chloroflexota bacterium]